MRIMHGLILGVGLLAAASAIAAAAADCPPRDASLVEQFVSADCADCWRQGDDAADERAPRRLDWIVPGPGGADAPLSNAALPEALERVARSGIGTASATQRLARSRLLAPPRATRLALGAGPAWHGYIGVQVDTAGPWPRGSQLWLALVELLPAGAEGNASARALVRGVAGALPIGRGAGSHLHAMRWPESARLERLQPRAWIESAEGRIMAIASLACPLR